MATHARAGPPRRRSQAGPACGKPRVHELGAREARGNGRQRDDAHDARRGARRGREVVQAAVRVQRLRLRPAGQGVHPQAHHGRPHIALLLCDPTPRGRGPARRAAGTFWRRLAGQVLRPGDAHAFSLLGHAVCGLHLGFGQSAVGLLCLERHPRDQPARRRR